MGAVDLLAGGTCVVGVRACGTGLLIGVTGELTLRDEGDAGTRAVVVEGVTAVVIGRGIGEVPTDGTGVVSSFGCVTPAPGRARSVMRTVSFFSGTAAVFAEGAGGGVGWVLLSLMIKNLAETRCAWMLQKNI